MFGVVLLLAGCGSGRSSVQPAPERQGLAAGAKPEKTTGVEPQAPATEKQLAPKASEVNLVQYSSEERPRIHLLYPEGWSVFRTITGDNLQISRDPIKVMVMTLQLRGQKPPMTADGMRREMQSWAPDADVKQLQVPGTVSAFEVKYSARSAEIPTTILAVDLYGTTFNQTLMFEAPTASFSDWEPVFRKMIASFAHSDLDAKPLGSQP
ncbi:MAG TPA: hypothetical protein VNT01_04445 [Symbiobacteriaceae bacterium]|nr:hypothetical protein [Symbiobacteriaceae bacterium]